MNFKKYYINEDKDPSDYPIDNLIYAITELSKKNNLPTPTKELDSGSDAIVFETNKDIVIRAEQIDEYEDMHSLKEILLHDDEIQETGGVAKSFGYFPMEIDNKQYLISYKEKVDQNFEKYLLNKYSVEDYKKIMHALHLYDFTDRKDFINKINTLLKYKETKKLAMAIKAGLPTGDLAPESNLGITKKGYIVAFDC
jgi:hypothetical protein